ncbi:MAG: ABC transporter ATP-binding protein [Acidimicrobiia bacterium]|nr:ABC transporter ATP-binding protein [Acidimicrobiia bacterium]
MVRCRAVSVRIDDAVLVDDVDLEIADGEWVSVIGPNGAGKTTLLRAIAGLATAEGEVELAGRSVRDMGTRERSRTVAVVPQIPVVPPSMPAVDYVLLGRTPHIPLFGVEAPDDVSTALTVLEQLDLTALADRRMETLSGGELQRVMLARALAQDAPVLLLDEPTTALDVGHQQEVLELVDELRMSRGLTVLSTMHDLTLAGQYADRLMMLAGGRVVASGSAEDVLTEANVARHYGARVRVLHEAGGIVVLPVRPVHEAIPR